MPASKHWGGFYLHLPLCRRLYLIDVYSKAEQEDLSPDDRRVLAEIVRQIHKKLKK